VPIFVDDRDLLQRFRNGEPEALVRVYWSYVGKIARIFRLGAVSPEEGSLRHLRPAASELEDLVQEVFTKAFRPESRRSYDGLRPYGPYLYAIARNLLADWWRRHGREIPTDWAFIEATVDQAASREPPPYADPTTVLLVERFLGTLPEDLRAVHRARFIAGLSQRDAAATLGIGRQSLRTLEARLMSALRNALEQEEAVSCATAYRPSREVP
jgi:RNA polymerase sigma factor (sigma-70 family)